MRCEGHIERGRERRAKEKAGKDKKEDKDTEQVNDKDRKDREQAIDATDSATAAAHELKYGPARSASVDLVLQLHKLHKTAHNSTKLHKTARIAQNCINCTT